MNKLKDIYFLFIIIFSGTAITFYHENPYGIVFIFLLGIILFYKNLAKSTKTLFLCLGLWLLYFFINYLSIKSFNRYFLIETPIKIIIAWLLIDYFRFGIFEKYEKNIYFLAISSLLFYVWQIINISSLKSFMSYFDTGGRYGYDIILYYINKDLSYSLFPRNCGFTWEPGPFASFLLLAIFVNLARTNFKVKRNFKLFVFIITLITTQSSTGFIGLLFLFVWYAYNSLRTRYFLILTPAILSIVILLFIKIPFLKDKIEKEYNQDPELTISYYESTDTQLSLGRFTSFKIKMNDFMNYPLFGTGGGGANIVSKQSSLIDVGIISGLGKIIGTYGLYGFTFFLFLIVKSGRYICAKYKYKGSWIFYILVLVISFSFSIVETPLFFVFYFQYVFISINKSKKIKFNL